VRTVAGKPVDLSEWAGKHTSAKALRAATDAIMNDVTGLLASLRNEEPPAVVFDPAKSIPAKPAETDAGSTVEPGTGAAQ
jgi:1-acyl-sn-glycerol-3-phosphate acyltransferase